MDNQQISKILYEISENLEMEDEPFRPRAYQRAARAIEAQDRDLNNIYKKGGIKALKEIPGIGQSISEKIEELLKTDRLVFFEELKKNSPVDISTLTSIEGLGPKKIKALYKKLDIRTLEELEDAAKKGKIRELENFGEKSEKNILKGIEFLRQGRGRFLLGTVLPLARELKQRFENLKEVKNIEVAGSLRRMKETIGDIDMLAISDHPEKVMDFFVSQPEIVNVYGKGKTKSSVRLSLGIDADLRVVSQESFGAALQYFTGNKDHNVALRAIAKTKGYKLNEYGLFQIANPMPTGRQGKSQIANRTAGKTEKEIYEKLGLEYIEPELREHTGEIVTALKKQLPNLLPYHSLLGDLQIQTTWSDGAVSIEKMAEAAIKAGLEYIVITDHTKSLKVAHGLDEKRISKQIEEIKKINQRFEKENINFRILSGSEVDILKDGTLDIDDEVLAKLDVVLGSIHGYFNLPKTEQTRRLEHAMENPNIDIIAHPTGRIINRREAYELDMDQIFKTAKNTGTILEINAYPDRLDLKDVYVKEAVRQNIKLTIDSDAHHPEHFHYLELGIAIARRGWAEKKDILNTLPPDQFLKNLPKHV